MEIVLVLAVSGLVIYFVISVSQKIDERSEPSPPPSRSYLDRSERPIPKPFDARTAQKPPLREVVSGSAFVIDGDSIVISKTQIRLFGVDAPEINHPYGQKAKWALVRICKGQTVRAEITERDDYGRCVARCSLPDGRDLSAEMVKLGMAIDWPKFSGGIYGSLEPPGTRKRLWLADARQKGRMHVWEQFEARKDASQERR